MRQKREAGQTDRSFRRLWNERRQMPKLLHSILTQQIQSRFTDSIVIIWTIVTIVTNITKVTIVTIGIIVTTVPIFIIIFTSALWAARSHF